MSLFVVFAYGSDPGDPQDSLVAVVPGEPGKPTEAKELAQKERLDSRAPLSWRAVNGIEGRREWVAVTPMMRYAIVELSSDAAPAAAEQSESSSPVDQAGLRFWCHSCGIRDLTWYEAQVHKKQHGLAT